MEAEFQMKSKKTILILFLLGLLVFSLPTSAQTGPDRDRPIPDAIAGLKLAQPVEVTNLSLGVLDTSLAGVNGEQRVIIRLSTASVGEQKKLGSEARNVKGQIEAEQDALLARIRAVDPNATVLAQLQVVMNALLVEVDAAALTQLAKDPAVIRIAPVGSYEIDLADTVPYIGASAVQAEGIDGSGIRVAVLDSGIDYTHAALGGSGDVADFTGNDPNVIEPGTFPTAKVVGGYDFVGSNWPNTPEQPDPDPLDDGPANGHGTHVSDIIGGTYGVAPGVDLYAVKVCSSVSTSCSGVALIQGMEFAVDPNGDGDPHDHVDIVNMSLGSNYGQPFDDDLSLAVDNASDIGVLTVASSGNSSDKPYITGSPAAAETALSVAQTAMPRDFLPFMEAVAPASIAGNYRAVFQPWAAPLTSVIEAPLQYGDGAGGNLNGCAPFAAGSLTGKIVLVDRGACNFTLKIKTVGDAGGLIGIIGLVAPGDPFTGGDGGDPVSIPGYMISQADSNALKSGLPDTVVRFDPAVGLPLIGTVIGSSSRGPRNSDSLLKPEIGAPGASVSAIAGSGTGTGSFGGTSGAAPMVTGAAALIKQTNTFMIPVEIKSRLMNTAETDIYNEAGGPLAPISRIGGGEVRADQAVFSPVAAWDNDWQTGSLSIGFVDAYKKTTVITRRIRVRNYSLEDLELAITPSFRYANDEATGAIEIIAPASVKVKATRDRVINVKIKIHGENLWSNYMNSGSMGADPSGLTINEFDGYLTFSDGDTEIHMPWHLLPRQDARVKGPTRMRFQDGVAEVPLYNRGVGTAQNDAYALVAISENQPQGERGGQAPTPDIRAVGVNTFPVPAGFCSAEPSFLWAFAINTWERQSHLLPVSHEVYLDTNQDGVDDYRRL